MYVNGSLTKHSAQGIGSAVMGVNPVTSTGEEKHLLELVASLLGLSSNSDLTRGEKVREPLSGIFFIAYSDKIHITTCEREETECLASLVLVFFWFFTRICGLFFIVTCLLLVIFSPCGQFVCVLYAF